MQGVCKHKGCATRPVQESTAFELLFISVDVDGMLQCIKRCYMQALILAFF